MAILSSRTDMIGARSFLSRPTAEVLAHASELLGWCVDLNYPVAREVLVPYFAQLGAVAVPAVSEAIQNSIRERDFEGARTMIDEIVAKWPRDAINAMRPELLRIAKMPSVSGEEHNASSFAVLIEHQIPLDADLTARTGDLLKHHPFLAKRLEGKLKA
jgi:hypothetical protein